MKKDIPEEAASVVIADAGVTREPEDDIVNDFQALQILPRHLDERRKMVNALLHAAGLSLSALIAPARYQ